MNFYYGAIDKKESAVAMLPEVDAIVENFTDIDESVYELWLRGLSISEATSELLKTQEVKEWGANIPPHTDLHKIVSMDTNDHYRIFIELEKILVAPHKLAEACTHQISSKNQKILIERFYALDDSVVREIIGKKLSGRNRKDLDDVEDKTGVLLRSCRRQFDNIKRVFKLVEEAPGSLVATIQYHFLLPDALCRKYAAIVFLLVNRFETNKRKLNYVTFEDLSRCAFAMMEHWCTTPNTTAATGNKPNTDDTCIDRDLLLQLRDLKCLMEREKEHKSMALCELRKVGGCPVAEAESNFKLLSRPLCTIATALHTPKELRDLFLDVVERVVEGARLVRWNRAQLTVFMGAHKKGGALLLEGAPSLKAAWESYMAVMTVCVIELHHG